ncbi:PLD nuclease N-terminal domain-containing protein [Streptomyces iconiensis]|uniref:PLD nuclease N-terminal domain-containing protein n=1 Tax=Streptomyces iconiensis TaxID=1384038 RepID=A0ABT6ZXL8_9ACTN|nr:PLD nuclease N-terminal domain-containing protein [Streptomyces iconiensis]MDJ1133819.1 PLD nuclease N-terminal domain-containing protein [Streptomyces iconiensis]
MIRYLPFLLILAVWIYAFIDCLNTQEKEVRKLPKVAWVIIILLFGQVLLGPIAWFAVGRPRRNAPYGATRPQERRWVAPDDNPDFLKSLGKDDPSAPEDPPPGTRSEPAPEPDPEPKPRGGNAGNETPEDQRPGPEDPPR